MKNIIVINLDRAKERREYITNQLDNQNLEYYLYSAFDGQNITNPTFQLPKISLKGKYRYGDNFLIGEIACTLSHIGAISMAKSLGLEYVIILEDDVEICLDFSDRLEYLFKIIPKNWEHIFLGGHIYQFNPIIMPSLHKSPKVSCTYSYILRKNVYDKAIKFLSSLETTTDDLYEYMKLNSYIFFPLFTYSIKTYSYINNEMANENPSKLFFKKYLKL